MAQVPASGTQRIDDGAGRVDAGRRGAHSTWASWRPSGKRRREDRVVQDGVELDAIDDDPLGAADTGDRRLERMRDGQAVHLPVRREVSLDRPGLAADDARTVDL